MSESPGTNVSYAAALINIEELRSYRAESKYNPLPVLMPELWGQLYSQAAERFPCPKNLYMDKPLTYQERDQVFTEVAQEMMTNGAMVSPFFSTGMRLRDDEETHFLEGDEHL